MPPAKKKLLPVIVPLVIIVVAAFVVYRYWQGRGVDDARLVLYGNVDLREVELAFMVQDRITDLRVDEGNVVKKGQLLGELDPERSQHSVRRVEAELEQARQKLAALEHGSRPQEIRRAKADVLAARAELLDAEVTYNRLRRLVEEDAASVQALDDALGGLEVRRAQLKAAMENLSLAEEGPRQEDIAAARAYVQSVAASLARARKDLEDTRLYAPVGGVIRSRIREPGDIAGPQRPVFMLAKLDPVWIRTYVPEPQLGKLAPGMTAKVTTDSFPDKTYPAWIGYISPTAEFTPKNVETPALRTRLVYQVWAYVCNPDYELRLGMPATVTVDLESRGTVATARPCSNELNE